MNTNRLNVSGLGALMLLGTAGGAAWTTPAHAQETEPESIVLTGVVRDFRERTAEGGHPDFERRPDHGFGVYAGSVEYFIGPGRKPVYSGGGYLVNQQWRDSAGRPIAPHLYNKEFVSGTGEAPNETSVILKDSSGVDAYEVEWIATTFNTNGTSSWTYRVRELDTGKDLSHWNLALSEDHEVASGTTPGYDLGVDGSTGFYGIKWDVEDGFQTGEFTIVLEGHYFGADLSCGVLAKGGNQADIGGIFAPTSILSDTGYPFNTEDMLIDNPAHNDSEGYGGNPDGGGVESGESFYTWYRDEPGLNMSKQLAITLDRQDDGSYVFDSSTDPDYAEVGGFFPIEGELFGNSGGSPDRNFHFTYELHTRFTYDANGDQFFRFTGDDDVYVYIDGKLAIDLGGVHALAEQYVDLRRFGLEDGETYYLDFFFSERHRTESNFRIETNLELESVDLPTISASFD